MEILAFLRDVAVPVVIFVVLPVFWWFQRDRRKSLAETAVAERTVGVDVNAREAGGLGASVAFVQEAFRVERESKDRQIEAQGLQIQAQEVEIAELKAEVADLRHSVSDRDERIDALTSEMSEMKQQIGLLTNLNSRLIRPGD